MRMCALIHTKAIPKSSRLLRDFLGFVGLTSCQANYKDSNQLCLHKEIQRAATLWIFTIDKLELI